MRRSKRTRRAADKALKNTAVVYIEHGYVSFAEGPADVVVCDFDIAGCDHQPDDIKVQGRRCRLIRHKARKLSRIGLRVAREGRQPKRSVDGYIV